MSAVTKTAIKTLLDSTATLTALLGTDELSNPAIFNAHMNQIMQSAGWTLPAITFREGDGSADLRFTSQYAGSEIFDFEIWAKTESGLVIPNIFAQLNLALHNIPLTLIAGRNYDCILLAKNLDLYDKTLKMPFGLCRYRLIVSDS